MLSPEQLAILKNLEFTIYASYPGLEVLGYVRTADGIHVQVAPGWFEFSYVWGLTTIKHSRIHKFDPATFLQHYKLFCRVLDPVLEARGLN